MQKQAHKELQPKPNFKAKPDGRGKPDRERKCP